MITIRYSQPAPVPFVIYHFVIYHRDDIPPWGTYVRSAAAMVVHECTSSYLYHFDWPHTTDDPLLLRGYRCLHAGA